MSNNNDKEELINEANKEKIIYKYRIFLQFNKFNKNRLKNFFSLFI